MQQYVLLELNTQHFTQDSINPAEGEGMKKNHKRGSAAWVPSCTAVLNSKISLFLDSFSKQ